MIKLVPLLTENKKILIPRRSKEERTKNHLVTINKQIQKYIKNGSKGDLDLRRTPIKVLPDNLKVGGNLYLHNTSITSLPDNLEVGRFLDLRNTPISKKYSAEEIKRMTPGIKGQVFVHLQVPYL